MKLQELLRVFRKMFKMCWSIFITGEYFPASGCLFQWPARLQLERVDLIQQRNQPEIWMDTTNDPTSASDAANQNILICPRFVDSCQW